MKSSRRKFLQWTLAAPLVARIGGADPGAAAEPLAVLVPGVAQAQFENPQIIKYDSQCFTINGVDSIIYSAAFHYERCPRELWRDRLMKLKRAGFNTIATYVFWNYHEPLKGKVDMSELEEFIVLVQQMGFWMVVRPGPYACAEWDAGGFPHWILAMQFPLRGMAPESVQSSQHWFNSVLPVIQRHQITAGGPVIMMQVENEYDYWKLPDAEKRQYITALANMAWNAGIDVPLITNWCKQARENSDPVMARIMDTADFYPRWDIVKGTVPRLDELRQQEPATPLGIAELQGGWFAKFGGKLSVDQPGVNGAQLNALTKTMLEHGVTFFSFYMGFGGTSFDWAAKDLITSYDYAAPLREPGGLWEKYYDARGVCAFLNRFGSVLARAQQQAGASCTNAAVSVAQRVNGASGALFVRENENRDQEFGMSFPDPSSPTHRVIKAPREGALQIGARGMKMLPLGTTLTGRHLLRYTTAEVLDFGASLDRPYVVLYDEPGSLIEVGFKSENQPQVEGGTAYQYWDSDYETIVLGFRLPGGESTEKMLLVNGLQVIAVPRERALKSWIAEISASVIPETEETDEDLPRNVVRQPGGPGTMHVPLITDAALLEGAGFDRHRAWVDLRFASGEHEVLTLLGEEPSKCLVDGAASKLSYDEHWRAARLHVSTPALPAHPFNLQQAEMWEEKFDPGSGKWRSWELQPLDSLGEVPYGYVKYRTQFTQPVSGSMTIATYDDDSKQVFINGRQVKEAASKNQEVSFSLSPYLQNGTNSIEIVYELFGSYNFGPEIARLKGVKSVKAGGATLSGGATLAGGGANLGNWQLQLRPAAMHGRRIDPEFSQGGWQPAAIGGAPQNDQILPAFCWIRTKFSLPPNPPEWQIMWNASIDATRDALLYLNGRFVGKYMTIGPQKVFYLPEPWLNFGEKGSNILTVVLAYTNQPGHIASLRIGPYEEFATRRTNVEFRWE